MAEPHADHLICMDELFFNKTSRCSRAIHQNLDEGRCEQLEDVEEAENISLSSADIRILAALFFSLL